jgi:hypothetical protein
VESLAYGWLLTAYLMLAAPLGLYVIVHWPSALSSLLSILISARVTIITTKSTVKRLIIYLLKLMRDEIWSEVKEL